MSTPVCFYWRYSPLHLPLGTEALYLDLLFIEEEDDSLSRNLYDKYNEFDFYIVNFPFLFVNTPFNQSHGVYISQLIRYVRCCSHYGDLCLSQFQLSTSPPSPGKPRENFFERANPGYTGNSFWLIPLPRGKNDGRIPGGGAKFSQTRRNCSLSLQKILTKTTRQYNFFIWRA